MRLLICFTAVLVLCLAPVTSHAALAPFGHDFESVDPLSTTALANLGFVVYGNVFTPSGSYIYGYGTFPAPNASAPGVPSAFSRVAVGEGGPTQGDQVIGIFSDYENTGHAVGNLIESNVFKEQIVAAGDVGSTWYFKFDAKFGDVKPDSCDAIAFIKVISPAPNYFLTNFQQMRITGLLGDGSEPYIPNPDWKRFQLRLDIDAGMVGSFVQVGFVSTTTYYAPSLVFYDNLEWDTNPNVLSAPGGETVAGVQLRVLGNPAIGGAAQQISFTTPQSGRVGVRVFDVEGRLVSTLVDREMEAGTHEVSWNGSGSSGQRVPSGIYFAEVVAGNERVVTKLIRAD